MKLYSPPIKHQQSFNCISLGVVFAERTHGKQCMYPTKKVGKLVDLCSGELLKTSWIPTVTPQVAWVECPSLPRRPSGLYVGIAAYFSLISEAPPITTQVTAD